VSAPFLTQRVLAGVEAARSQGRRMPLDTDSGCVLECLCVTNLG
jgi:hypothetical protein